jgi:hypothetical protein
MHFYVAVGGGICVVLTHLVLLKDINRNVVELEVAVNGNGAF